MVSTPRAMVGRLPAVALSVVLLAGGGVGASCATPVGPQHNGYLVCDPARRLFCDPSTTISVPQGARFSILLDSSLGTGYRWRIVQPPDPGIVQAPSAGEYRQNPSVHGLAPGRGQDVWTFTATGPGRAVIAFQYVPLTGTPTADAANGETFVVEVS